MIAVLALSAASVLAQGGGPDSHGLEIVGGIGGFSRAMATLPDSLLVAEGGALLKLERDGSPLGRVTLGRGEIQDVVVQGDLVYVLTEQGLCVVALATLEERLFMPGGGQSVAVTSRAVYAAAQQAGIRAALLDPEGLPDRWDVVAAFGAVGDLDVDVTEAFLYAAEGADGVGIYALLTAESPQKVAALGDIGAVDTVAADRGRLLVGSGHRLHVFDLSHPTDPVLLHPYDPLNRAQDVLLRQEWAFVADEHGGLKRYAIGDLRDPRYVDVLWHGAAYGLASDDRYLYVAGGWEGILAFDAGLPGTVTPRGRVMIPGKAESVTVAQSGNRRWMVAAMAESTDLVIVDWNDIDRPVLRSTLTLPGQVQAVALRDTIGFAALDDGTVVFFSAVNLAAPRVLASLTLDSVPHALAWEGTFLYVAAGEAGLYIIETVRPAAPVVLGRLPVLRPDQPFLNVTLEGGKRVYVSTGASVVIADVDVPEQPQVLAAIEAQATAAAVRNFIVYAVDGPALTTINAASSNEPVVLAAYQAVGVIRDIARSGSAIWLAGDGQGSAAMALSLLADGSVSELRAFGLAGSGRRISGLADGTALLVTGDGSVYRLSGENAQVLRQGGAMGWQSLHATGEESTVLIGGEGWGILNTADPAHPVLQRADAVRYPVEDVVTLGERIYAVTADGGIVEMGPPGTEVRRWQPSVLDGAIRAIAGLPPGVSAWNGGILYAVEAGPESQGAVRVMDPDTFITIATVPLPSAGTAVAVHDGRVYAAFGGSSGGVAVVDVSAPTAGLNTLAVTPIPAHGLAVRGGGQVGYAVEGQTLTVFELAGPSSVSAVNRLTLPQPARDLVLVGGRYLVGLFPEQHLLLLDISAPELPVPVAVMQTAAQQVAGLDGALYLAAGDAGLQVVSLESRRELEDRVMLIDSEPASALWCDGQWLYAAGTHSLRLFDLQDPLSPRLVTSLPLEAGRIRSMIGRATRRDGRWLYLATDHGLLVVRHAFDAELDEPVVHRGIQAQKLLAVDDRYLYMQGDKAGLDIVAFLSEGVPDWQITYPLAGTAVQVIARDESLLVGTETDLYVLGWDAASRPPFQTGVFDGLSGVPVDIEAAMDGAVWAATGERVYEIDVRDPTHPTLLREIDTIGEVHGIALAPSAKTLAVASSQCGVRLVDLSESIPQEIGFWRGDVVHDVFALSGGLWVAAGESGISLLNLVDGAESDSAPGPFSPEPPDGMVGTGESVMLRWLPEPDACSAMTYRVLVGQGDAPPEALTTTDRNTVTLTDLPLETEISWQVEVMIAGAHMVQGPVWRFNTGMGSPAEAPAAFDSVRVLPPTPTIVVPEDTEAAGVSTGLDARMLVPLLIGGGILEIVLLSGLYRLWRVRRQR